MDLGCSSEKTDTSSSATETKKIPSHVVNLKESKTHLFYVIQSDNESHAKSQHLIELKISKGIPSSRKSISKKMRTLIPSRLASIQKRTDHPSFVVLPQVLSRGRENVEKNQSTSENSNETYVIRSKEDNKTWGSKGRMPILFGSLWKRNSETGDATFLHGLNNLVANTRSDEYCECDKETAHKSTRNSLNLDDKIETLGSAQNTSKGYLKKEDLFNINFAKPNQSNMPQRLRAGQDYDRRYKSCHMCPNMTRIFPPTSSRQPTAFQADSASNSTLNNRSGYAKINFKLVRQCLIHGSANEKTRILDAIRLRMKSSDAIVAIGTIEHIVKFDLFGVQCECRSKPLLEDLFWPLTPSYELQTSAAQFVNALVSYKLGRSYFNNRSVIRMLTWGDMGRDNIDPIMGDNLIGVMMKLSSSRFQRTDMIKNDLLRWLLQHMQEKEYSASKYHLQCMAGLLRNLLRGYNLENLSPTEVQNLIILLGRYMDHEDELAKRYFCDSLMILFQNLNCVARAKDLNFQRVIQEHVTNAPNPAQRELLIAVYHLLNRSASTTSFKTQKFDIRSEDETFLDADLEPGGKEDSYLGECLIREKFNVDAGAQRQEKTADQEANADESQKDGRLITRVFVEHLNCFLPNIESNRIFPLCNSRCADKIGNCSHVGDIQPKKRQPYIPPNSRLPRQKQSVSVSADGMLEDGYNKSMRKSKMPNTESNRIELLTSRVSTISHDTTAAKWNQIGKGDSDAKVTTSSTDTRQMEKIFEGHTMKTNGVIEGEEIIATESYRYEPFGAADALDDENKMDTAIDDRLLNQQSPDVEKESNKDGEVAAGTETKNREEFRRDSLYTEPVEAIELTDGQSMSKISGALKQRTGSPTRTKHVLDSTVSEENKKKLNKSSSQQNLHSDKEGGRKLPPSSSFDSNDDGRKLSSEETRFKESLVNRDMERGETGKIKNADHQSSSRKSAKRPIARHSSENQISHQGIPESTQVKRTSGITGREIHSKSEETLTNLGITEMAHEHFAKNKAGCKFPVRSTEIGVKKGTDQGLLLNARSEGIVKKIPVASTSKIDVNEMGILLKVRSEEEGVRNPKGRGDKLQEGKSSNQKSNVALQARSEATLVKTKAGNKMKAVKSNENPVSNVQIGPKLQVRSAKMLEATQSLMSDKSKDTVARHKNVDAVETGNKLNARSHTLLTKEPSPSYLIESRAAQEEIVTQQIRTTQLHARSMEILKNHESHQLVKKSKSDVVNIASNANICQTKHLSSSPPSPQPTTNERTNYQLLKSSSDDLLGSTRNKDYAHEPTGNVNWISRTKLLNQFAVRSNEFVKQIGRTQSATIFEGLTSSRNLLNSSRINSSQTSKHCVDCRGNGYVLRERPSQPCDRCTDSLSRYRNFVDTLADMDQRRDVTRTDDEWIKINLVNKSDEKLNSRSNQEKPNGGKLGDSNVGETSKEAKGNADGVRGNSGTTQTQKPREMLDKQQKENIASLEVLVGDPIVGSTQHSLAEKSDAMTTAENATTNEENQSETDAILLCDEIRQIMPTSSFHEQSYDFKENASSLRSQSAKLIDEDVKNEKSQLTSDNKTTEQLPLDAAVETTRPNLFGEQRTVETEVCFKKDLPPHSNQISHHIPKGTETEHHQHSLDEATTRKSTKQVDEKDDKVTSARSNEDAHKLEEPQNGGRGIENKDSKNLNKMLSIEAIIDSEYNQISTAASANERSETETHGDREVVGTKTSKLSIPDSVNLLQDTAKFVGTTNEVAAIDHATSNQKLNLEASVAAEVAAEVADHKTLNVSSNVIHTSDDNHLRQTVNNQQLSDRVMNSPAAVHLFPRSLEFIDTSVMRSRPVDSVAAFDESKTGETPPEKLLDGKGLVSEIPTVSLNEKTESADETDRSEEIELKDEGESASTNNTNFNNSSNVAKNIALVPKPEDEKWRNQLINTTAANDHQKSVEPQSSSDIVNNRRDNQISLNAPVEAVSGEYPVPLSFQITEPINDGKSNAEATVSGDEVLPAALSESLKNEHPNEAFGVTDDTALPARSKENVTEISAQPNNRINAPLSKQDEENNTFVPVSLDLVNVENVDRPTKLIATKKPRLNDMVVTRNQKQEDMKIAKQKEKKERMSGQRSHIASSDISLKKPIDNKSSTVLDEVFTDEQNLRSDEQSTKIDTPDVTDIDHGQLGLEGFGYFSDGIIEKVRRKTRTVNSTCGRQLLNNDELINRLSEKVLEKLANKVHRCGPNCKSRCGGGLNSYLKAHEDNNLNWE